MELNYCWNRANSSEKRILANCSPTDWKIMNKNLKRILLGMQKLPVLIESLFDKNYLAPDVPLSQFGTHQKCRQYLYEIGNKPGMRVLEIGSREVIGPSNARDGFAKAEYVGFDYYPGKNVDVVGDAHRLSSYFKEGEQFDIVYSIACFEHFAMPWVVAAEIAKVLKVGGIVLIQTHFSFASHERPWHFYQFSDMGLRVLFSRALGFECMEAGMSNPMVGRFSSLADAHLKNKPVRGLYADSAYLGRKVREVKDFDWGKLDLKSVVGKTQYPKSDGETSGQSSFREP
jgi:SAM-dependent methyltransferase